MNQGWGIGGGGGPKKRPSDLVNLVSVLTSEQTQPLIFHTLGRIARLPGRSGVRTSENQITPGAQLYPPPPPPPLPPPLVLLPLVHF
jgi:hypothetical protein